MPSKVIEYVEEIHGYLRSIEVNNKYFFYWIFKLKYVCNSNYISLFYLYITNRNYIDINFIIFSYNFY